MPIGSKLDDATAANHAVRFYLVGLLGRRAVAGDRLEITEEPVLVELQV